MTKTKGMAVGSKAKLAEWSRPFLAGILTVGLMTGQPALAAMNVDGIYSGSSTLTFGNPAVCGASGNVGITVKDGKIATTWGDYPVQLEVADNGGFHGNVRVGRGGERRQLVATGKISGLLLEAALETTLVRETTRLCSYKWALKKQ